MSPLTSLSAAAGVGLLVGSVVTYTATTWRGEAKYSALVASNAKVMQDYSDRAYEAETVQREEGERRQNEKDRIQNEARDRIAAVHADAVRAASERDRLRDQLANFTASRHSVGQDPASSAGEQGDFGEDAIGVLAAMLDRHSAELVEVGRYADELRGAGLACERQYDSLNEKDQISKSDLSAK